MITVRLTLAKVYGFCCSVTIRDARTGRKLAETRDCPWGMESVAYRAAEAICEARGWREEVQS